MTIHISNTAKCSPDQGVFDHSLASLVPDQFLHVGSPNADQVHVVSDPGQMSVPRQQSAQVGRRSSSPAPWLRYWHLPDAGGWDRVLPKVRSNLDAGSRQVASPIV